MLLHPLPILVYINTNLIKKTLDTKSIAILLNFSPLGKTDFPNFSSPHPQMGGLRCSSIKYIIFVFPNFHMK